MSHFFIFFQKVLSVSTFFVFKSFCWEQLRFFALFVPPVNRCHRYFVGPFSQNFRSAQAQWKGWIGLMMTWEVASRIEFKKT